VNRIGQPRVGVEIVVVITRDADNKGVPISHGLRLTGVTKRVSPLRGITCCVAAPR
jgi:hypothetical protein